MRQLLQIVTTYYKMRQLLQNATFITNCNSTLTLMLIKEYYFFIIKSSLRFLSLRLGRQETWKFDYCSEKFNIVSNDHGGTEKCDFCVSVCKTKFTDNHTPDAIYGFRDSVQVCKMYHYYFTIRKNVQHFYSFPSNDASDCNG